MWVNPSSLLMQTQRYIPNNDGDSISVKWKCNVPSAVLTSMKIQQTSGEIVSCRLKGDIKADNEVEKGDSWGGTTSSYKQALR